MTSITLRIPLDVVDSMKHIAPLKGVTGYQTLLKSYISDGLRQDEARLGPAQPVRSLPPVFKREGAQPVPARSNARLNALLDSEDAAKVSPIAKPKRRASRG